MLAYDAVLGIYSEAHTHTHPTCTPMFVPETPNIFNKVNYYPFSTNTAYMNVFSVEIPCFCFCFSLLFEKHLNEREKKVKQIMSD